MHVYCKHDIYIYICNNASIRRRTSDYTERKCLIENCRNLDDTGQFNGNIIATKSCFIIYCVLLQQNHVSLFTVFSCNKIMFHYLLCSLATKSCFIIYCVFLQQNHGSLFIVFSCNKIMSHYLLCSLATKSCFIICCVLLTKLFLMPKIINKRMCKFQRLATSYKV